MKVAVVLLVCLGGVFGANPNYSYHVKIDDPSHVNFQEKAETRKGEDAQGFYSVLEPNGALRTVSYTADERGFNPIVSYSYGHPQSSVAVHSATGAAAIVKQHPGVYAPAYVSDNRVQIVDKSNIYAAPPPAIDFQAFTLPGPSAPVIVPQPLRAAAPVRLASAAITTNYAPAYVPPPRAYLPPPQPQVVAVQRHQPQVVAVQHHQPQVVAVQHHQPRVVAVQHHQPQVYAVQHHQPQIYSVPQPQVFARQPQVVAFAPQPQTFVSVQQPQVVQYAKVQPAKFLTVPVQTAPVKVVKATKAVAIVKDSYAEPPSDTFRDPNAPSYPDRVKIVEQPTAEYGVPGYVPGPLITEAPLKVKVVEQTPVQVVQTTKVIQPVVQQQVTYLPPPPAIAVQKVVAAPPPVIQVQKFVAPPPPAIAVQAVAPPAPVISGLYAGAIGYHTHSANPNSYVHNYGTQGFQVTSSRQFNKAVLAVPQYQKQIIRAPTPVYGPPPQAIRVEQPRPVYGPPPTKFVQQQVAIAQPVQYQTVQAVAPAPPPVFAAPQPIQEAPQVFAAPAPPPALAVAAAPPSISLTGKKQNPLTFAYSYDQGGAKVTHSYSGSGW